jgi:hypothetical protein
LCSSYAIAGKGVGHYCIVGQFPLDNCRRVHERGGLGGGGGGDCHDMGLRGGTSTVYRREANDCAIPYFDIQIYTLYTEQAYFPFI